MQKPGRKPLIIMKNMKQSMELSEISTSDIFKLIQFIVPSSTLRTALAPPTLVITEQYDDTILWTAIRGGPTFYVEPSPGRFRNIV